MSAVNEFWAEAPQVVRLFPSFVWKCQLRPEAFQPINDATLARLDAIRHESPPLARGEAWQSGHGLHKLPELSGLVRCIRSATEHALEFLRVGQYEFQVTGCWANVSAPGAAHATHAHPNNYLSGVYYVQVQAGADTINFRDPRPETRVFRPPVSELNAYNTDQVVVRVSTGSLIVFPAWLQHSVDPNRSDHPRVSVSFNIMFAAFAETMAEPLWGDP